MERKSTYIPPNPEQAEGDIMFATKEIKNNPGKSLRRVKTAPVTPPLLYRTSHQSFSVFATQFFGQQLPASFCLERFGDHTIRYAHGGSCPSCAAKEKRKIQTKLTIGSPNDVYKEQETDRVL